MSRIDQRYEQSRPALGASLPPDVADDRNLTPKQAAIWLGISAKTLKKWRNAKPPKGPPCLPISENRFGYPLDKLRAWRESRIKGPLHWMTKRENHLKRKSHVRGNA